MRFLLQLLLISLVAIPSIRTADTLCFPCIEVIEFVENLVINDEDDIEGKLDKKCKETFPSSWGTAICDALVETALDDIVKDIENGLTPDDVCQKLGACHWETFTAKLLASRVAKKAA